MHKHTRIAASALLLASVALPAMAQSPATGNATTAPATRNAAPAPTTAPPPRPATPPAASNAAATPSQRNPVLTDEGEVRTSKLVGSSVYNDHDEKIGSIDDIILGKDNNADKAILSVGGFLGVGTKLVAVPYSQLKLGDTQTASSDNKVVLPGATQDSLKSQPEFHYRARS
jgi:sporulation protein YlmC with PRC-barrel domain